jgi:hypothetical protein
LSKSDSRTLALETVALSEELERIESLYNALAEVSSDCAYETAPELACESGECVESSAP